MRNILFNLGYFTKEIKKIIRLNLLSNIFSFIGTSLILFILGMVLAGWGISSRLIVMMKEEAEISAFFDKNLNAIEISGIVETVKGIEGVWDARLVDEYEAYRRMEKNLGEEAKVLKLFDENPFESFIEIRIHLDSMDKVISAVKNTEGINFVRDNREVLLRIQNIVDSLNIIGLLIILAVGITAVVIISHMIRQGIYINRDQINTLKLLGAPNSFIGFPFVMVGIILTFGGGVLATALITYFISTGYEKMAGTISFIPLPLMSELIEVMVIIIPSISILLGILGSLFGLSSIKEDRGSSK